MDNYLLIIAASLGLLVVILSFWIVRLELRVRRLLKGKNARTLEDTLNSVVKDILALKQYRADSSDYLQSIEERIRKSIQHVETIRFNPFKGTGEGGNQSFATAFLNEKGEGVVFSSLHIRDRVSIFAKPVKSYESEHELSDEERHVIGKAKEILRAKARKRAE